jgi:hypothetical protein
VTRIKKGDNVELELADIIGETDWAVHCRVKWDGGTEDVWFAKSQIKGIVVPRVIAKKKGFEVEKGA